MIEFQIDLHQCHFLHSGKLFSARLTREVDMAIGNAVQRENLVFIYDEKGDSRWNGIRKYRRTRGWSEGLHLLRCER